MSKPDPVLGKAEATREDAAAAAPTDDSGGMAAIREYVRLHKACAKRKRDDAVDKARMAQLEPAIIAWMQDHGMQSTRVDGATPHLITTIGAAKIDPDIEPEEIVAAAKAAGLDWLAKESVNWQTLGAYVREQHDKDEPIPEPLANVIRVTAHTKLGVRT